MSDRYVICMGCGQVFPDSNGEYLYGDEPSPCCGCSGEDLLTWPDIEVEKYLEIVQRQDLQTPQGQRVAIVFLCSALEALLESELSELLFTMGTPTEVVKALLNRTKGVNNMKSCFNQLNKQSLNEILESTGLSKFMPDWASIVQHRNNFAHGKYSYRNRNPGSKIAEEDLVIKMIENLSDEYYRAFATIHNYVYQEVGDGLASDVSPL